MRPDTKLLLEQLIIFTGNLNKDGTKEMYSGYKTEYFRPIKSLESKIRSEVQVFVVNKEDKSLQTFESIDAFRLAHPDGGSKEFLEKYSIHTPYKEGPMDLNDSEKKAIQYLYDLRQTTELPNVSSEALDELLTLIK